MAVQSSGGSPSVLVDSGVASASGCRVVGCLLGQQQGRVVEISNCFELVVNTMDDHVQVDLELLKRKLELCTSTLYMNMTHVDVVMQMQPCEKSHKYICVFVIV
jgi:hypothetical protein